METVCAHVQFMLPGDFLGFVLFFFLSGGVCMCLGFALGVPFSNIYLHVTPMEVH